MSTKRRKKRSRVVVFVAIVLLACMASGIVFSAAVIAPEHKKAGEPRDISRESGDFYENNESEIKEPTPEEIKENAINEKISAMSLEERVCQMFVVSPETLTGVDQVVSAGNATKTALQKTPVGGVIFFAPNLTGRTQTEEMLNNYKAFSKEAGAGVGIFLSVDEEGGRVARCAEKLGTRAFNPMYDYKSAGEETAYGNAFFIGSDISGIGFNLDFAPVADVWSNSSNTVIGKRAYSDNYEEASKLVASAVKGYKDAGVACTLKHFPGHGDTAEDSHTGTAVIKKSLEQIKTEELVPFVSGINAGAQVVMMGHLTVPSVDDKPASLSSFWIEDCLRNDLGFDGVVITDALSMQAVSNLYSTESLGVKAIEAGNDILMCLSGFSSMKAGVINAVNNGTITEERINKSVKRILSVKYDMGIM